MLLFEIFFLCILCQGFTYSCKLELLLQLPCMSSCSSFAILAFALSVLLELLFMSAKDISASLVSAPCWGVKGPPGAVRS